MLALRKIVILFLLRIYIQGRATDENKYITTFNINIVFELKLSSLPSHWVLQNSK